MRHAPWRRKAPCVGLQNGLPTGPHPLDKKCRLTYPLKPPFAGGPDILVFLHLWLYNPDPIIHISTLTNCGRSYHRWREPPEQRLCLAIETRVLPGNL